MASQVSVLTMLDWLKKIGGSSPHWRNFDYPAEELEWLEKDFKPLDVLRAGVCGQIMQYLASGEGESVLQTLAGMRAASGGLALRCRNNGGRLTPDRDRFFAATTILDPAFHLRLARVYDAASRYQIATGLGMRASTPGLKGGAEWLEAYLWEALPIDEEVDPQQTKPSRLSVLELERMLELHGTPGSWLVRGALIHDVANPRYGTHAGKLLLAVPGFAESFSRHGDMVRECLNQSDHRSKTHAMEVLLEMKISPAQFADVAALHAVSEAKEMREAAQAWIGLDPAAVMPEVRRIAVSGGPAERFQAVLLLEKMGGDEMSAFFNERLAAEKSVKVRDLLEGILRASSQADPMSAPAATALPALPEVPDALADQSLSDGVLKDVQAVIQSANAEMLARWEKIKSCSWAPKAAAQFPQGTAEEWFQLLQTLKAGVAPKMKSYDGFFRPTDALIQFAAHREFKLVHVFRWAVLLDADFCTARCSSIGAALQCFNAWIEKHGPIPYRDIATLSQRLGFKTDWIAKAWMMQTSYSSGPFTTQPDKLVWPYFAENLNLVEKMLGWLPNHGELLSDTWESVYRPNAWRALATLPVPPPALQNSMWGVALGTSKTERPLAQEALKNAPDREARLIAALASGQQEQRTVAAEWIGRLKLVAAIPALRTAIAKEKYDSPKAAMIGTLERLGVPPDEFLDREGLLKEARKITAKPPPAALAWFPMQQLPVVHWSDNGAVVAAEIIQAWLIQTCKAKQAEPNALVRRYAASFCAEERETLGAFILNAWLAEDVMPHPRTVAEQNAMRTAQAFFQSAQQYPQYYTAYVGVTLEQIYARVLPAHLEVPRGSANDSKGILAVAGACVGADAAGPVAQYLKKWYGTRVHQSRALLQMLAWVDHPAATQTLLAIGTRFRTKSLQEEATRLAHGIAERKGWSLAELADRTIPAAGLDDDGVLPLDFGARQFTARLDAALNLVLQDPEGKVIKALPDPRKDDDAEKAAAAAKKQLGATRKELKQVLEQQRLNFYEAMCVQRTWKFEDWRPFLCQHPIVRHFCQRLVWSAQRGAEALHFRPLADGSFTDVEDNALTLEEADVISLAHQTTLGAETAKAWMQHLSDYEVVPLFDQLGRSAPEMTEEKKRQRELKDFEGWMSDTFKIRGRATKLGYTRGSTGDGGSFSEYTKRFPTTGLVAEIAFTGSFLPETQLPAALTTLSFRREQGSQKLPLSDVPAVLLAECWNDYRQLAVEGSGFDPEWEKKGLF